MTFQKHSNMFDTRDYWIGLYVVALVIYWVDFGAIYVLENYVS